MTDQPTEAETLQGHVEPDITPPAQPAASTQPVESPKPKELDISELVAREVAKALEAAKVQATPVAPTTEATNPEPDLSVLWYTDPAKAAALVEERAYQRAKRDYQTDQATRTFWNEFKSRNPDLKEATWVAEGVLRENPVRFRDMDDDTGLKVLAEETRKKLQRTVGGLTQAPKEEPVVLEGGTNVPSSPPSTLKAEPAGDSGTLSDWIRERRQARRQGGISRKTG